MLCHGASYFFTKHTRWLHYTKHGFTSENVLWSEMDLTKPKYTNIFSFVGSMMPYYDAVMVGVLYLFNCVEIQYIHISVTILE